METVPEGGLGLSTPDAARVARVKEQLVWETSRGAAQALGSLSIVALFGQEAPTDGAARRAATASLQLAIRELRTTERLLRRPPSDPASLGGGPSLREVLDECAQRLAAGPGAEQPAPWVGLQDLTRTTESTLASAALWATNCLHAAAPGARGALELSRTDDRVELSASGCSIEPHPSGGELASEQLAELQVRVGLLGGELSTSTRRVSRTRSLWTLRVWLPVL